ncbi:unnamed protein product [Brachionus calyciflorus]|uniref:TATA box-binding protein-like 1 n=1 Tax=Brachionus calyciflorus TaxID=104777 RepID=A0A813VQ24_9BILA|nr:unnamed protein product [Brachionus calyciflorus]
MSDLTQNNKNSSKLNKKYAVLNSQCKVKSHESNLDIFISNVVCSYSTRCHLNLKRIAMHGMHVEYKRENNMVNMRLRKPLSTATIWSSGKITCTGANTELDAYKAARRFCRLLQKMKFKVRLSNYRVVNVLATCQVMFHIDLNKVANEYKQECSYEPELHPGATFRIKEYRCTLKLFTTGSITLTAPNVLHAQKSIDFIYPILSKCRRVSREEVEEDVALLEKPEPLTSTYLVTTPVNNLNTTTQNILVQNPGPTIINLNRAADGYLTSSSSSLSNDSFQTGLTNSFNNLNYTHTTSYPNFSHFNHHHHLNPHHHHHNHFFNDNLIIDNVYEDFLQ